MSGTDVISDEQLKCFQQTFAHSDKDKDGKINQDEFKKALKNIGIIPTPEELQGMLKDFNGEYIDIYRFSFILYHYIRGADSQEELIRAFSVFDPNGQGFITTDNVRNILSNLRHPLPSDKIEKIIQRADPQGTGKITPADLVKQIRPQ